MKINITGTEIDLDKIKDKLFLSRYNVSRYFPSLVIIYITILRRIFAFET